MKTCFAFLFALALSACGAMNAEGLRQDHSAVLAAHSAEDLPATYARTLRGMQACRNEKSVQGDYVPGVDTANITVSTASLAPSVYLTTHMQATDTGTDARVYYRFGTWKKSAKQMQILIEGQKPDC